MRSPIYRSLVVCAVAAVAAVAGFTVWRFPFEPTIDLVAFETVVRSFYNPPYRVSGSGKPDAAWTVWQQANASVRGSTHNTVVISIQDDSKGFFQESPPAPVDMAVIFKNIFRLGKRHVACAALLSWEKPDPIGLRALELTLGRFDSLVMATPLTRSAVPGAMPPAFRRGSLAEQQISGDLSPLPRINRITIPSLILGGENAIAGFSILESEPNEGQLQLLARWDDRVIFSFSLLAGLQKLKTPLDSLRVRLGDAIVIGANGVRIPIDAYGRLRQNLTASNNTCLRISAEYIVDLDVADFPAPEEGALLLRDDQSLAEPATRVFSSNIANQISAIARYGPLTNPQVFSRLGWIWEMVLLGGVCLVLGLISLADVFAKRLLYFSIILTGLGAQWVALGMANIWLPGIAIIVAAVSATCASEVLDRYFIANKTSSNLIPPS